MRFKIRDLHFELELESEEMALIVTYLAFLALLQILATVNHLICHIQNHDDSVYED
jgi:hypothetical protein